MTSPGSDPGPIAEAAAANAAGSDAAGGASSYSSASASGPALPPPGTATDATAAHSAPGPDATADAAPNTTAEQDPVAVPHASAAAEAAALTAADATAVVVGQGLHDTASPHLTRARADSDNLDLNPSPDLQPNADDAEPLAAAAAPPTTSNGFQSNSPLLLAQPADSADTAAPSFDSTTTPASAAVGPDQQLQLAGTAANGHIPHETIAISTEIDIPQPQPGNGDARPSETDSDDMSGHRPTLPSPHPSIHQPLRPPSYSGSPLPPPSGSSYHGSGSGQPSPYGSYATPPATSGGPSDPHRPSPSAGAGVTLPSMRTMEELSRQQSTPSPHSISSSVAGGTSSYYTHQAMAPAQQPSHAYAASPMHQGYPVPGPPVARGPKKEIKRRTKTGCLTCRKRRIKCDETHPTCNNCKKSKRDCLGYDPIFRQQPGGQPGANLQPSTGSPTAAGALPVSPSSRHLNSYGSQPAILPSGYTSSPALQPTSNHHTPSPQLKPDSHYGYPPNSQPSRYYSPTSSYDAPRNLDHKPLPPPHALAPAQPPAKTMKIDGIIDMLGPAPPPQTILHNDQTFQEVTRVYHEMYAAGLAGFFETTWYYFAENGVMSFPREHRLVELMASFLKILEAVKANDHAQMAHSGVLETRIVWELSRTAYQSPDTGGSNTSRYGLPPEGDPQEARGRLMVVEALLSGEYLQHNPLSPPVADADHHRSRQFDFWHSLADFVRQRENPDSPQAVRAREDNISRMRLVLDGRENRDLLYSIAVTRELAPSYGPTYGTSLPQHIDETDPKSRLAVASRFILDESQVSGGTTNVVRRFSDIASRAFVNPGVNVIRRA